MKTECLISGTTGGLTDPNYCYKISWSLTRLVIKLAGQTYKSTFFSAVDDLHISLSYSISYWQPYKFQTWPRTCATCSPSSTCQPPTATAIARSSTSSSTPWARTQRRWSSYLSCPRSGGSWTSPARRESTWERGRIRTRWRRRWPSGWFTSRTGTCHWPSWGRASWWRPPASRSRAGLTTWTDPRVRLKLV